MINHDLLFDFYVVIFFISGKKIFEFRVQVLDGLGTLLKDCIEKHRKLRKCFCKYSVIRKILNNSPTLSEGLIYRVKRRNIFMAWGI